MIKIQKYDKEKQKLSFTTDMPLSLANAVRRSVLEIPTLAVDEVEISKNDSALYDEILAHRLGLVPIKLDKGLKEIKFKLQAKGPKIVYSTELKPSVGTGYGLPLVILDEGQAIQLVATARIGTGINHIKHSPGLIYYRNEIDEELLDYVHVDEEGNISYNEEELKGKKVSEDIMNKIKKLNKTNQLKFTVESWGQIEVKNILSEAIDILDKNLNELEKSIK